VNWANWIATDTTGYLSDDPLQAGFRPGEQELFQSIKIIVDDDTNDPNFGSYLIDNTSGLRDVVDVAAWHYYTDDDSSGRFKNLADNYDMEVWNSEAQATFSNSTTRPNNNTADPTKVGTQLGGVNSPLEMGVTVVKGFVNSRRTHFIYQPAIGSFYEGGQYSYKEIISARDPWSGWIHYDAAVAILQHFTSFAVVGWENDTNTAGIWRGIPQASVTTATGTNNVNGRNGGANYMTLGAPDKSDFSTIIVNDSQYAKTYRITPTNFTFPAGQALAVWATSAADEGEAFNADYKEFRGNVTPDANGTYVVAVEPWSIVTVTSLDVTGDANWATPLPVEGERTVLDAGQGVLWADDFDYTGKTVPVLASDGSLSGATEDFVTSRGGATGAIPLYTWDQNGAFEAYLAADGEWVLRQQVDTETTGVGGYWNNGDPLTSIGDLRWSNYYASTDVRFERTPSSSQYAAIAARLTGGENGWQIAQAPYAVRLYPNGNWQLLRRGTTVASGVVAGYDPAAWTNIGIKVAGATATAYIDGQPVGSYTDAVPYLTGRVVLASSFYNVQFDNLSVERVDGYLPYYGDLIDGMDMKTLDDPPAPKLQYTGTWAHANGQGMHIYGRTQSTSSAAGSTVSYTFTGTGIDLVGPNTGTGVIDVAVDGTTIAYSQATQASGQYQQTYALRGLKLASHTVTFTLVSGTLAVDAVGVLTVPPEVPPATDALAALVDQAESVWQTPDFTADDWATFQAALAAAQDAVDDPAGYGLDAEGAEQLATRLQGSMAPLSDEVASLETTWIAVVAGDTPALPATVLATMDDASTQAVPITWNLTGLDFSQPWTTVAVTGAYGWATARAFVEVIPADVVVFGDINGTAGGTLGYDSPAYNAVAALVGSSLLNPTPDQVYENSATWGHYGASASGTKAINYKGIVAGDYSKLTTTGVYTDNAVGATLSYTATLPAGKYQIAFGSYAWWTNERTANVFLDYDGVEHQVGAFTLNSSNMNQFLSYEVTLAAAGTLTLRLVGAANPSGSSAQSPLLSWVGIAELPLVITPGTVGISGTVEAGQTVTATPGTWDPSTVDLAYQWQLDGVDVVGANSSSYTIETADVGKTLTVVVTGSATGYSSVSATSPGQVVAAPVDKSALAALVAAVENTAQATLKGEYTDASYDAFQDALDDADDVLASSTVTQGDVDAAVAALQAAVDALWEVQEITAWDNFDGFGPVFDLVFTSGLWAE
ncbi:MAG: Ig-like domain-containing protein, partial [Bifidobacteriaceae bacterium]|nr:Ig-like domain-containing protein [Bifidobacteriaceae bacterium]